MTTTIFETHVHDQRQTETTGKRKSGFFARLLDRLIEARLAEARTRLTPHLVNMPDQRLKEMGLSAQDIQLMREKGRIPRTIWS